MVTDAKSAEVHRILGRFLVEVVETHALCPWARTARTGGELGIAILWGTPTLDAWIAAAERVLAGPEIRVAMLVAPELAIAPGEFRAVRDAVAARLPAAGIAEFHPDAALDLASPARLVPFLRRAPDPMLQLVPLAILNHVRGAPPVAERAHQAQILGGHAPPPREDVATQIAAANHATVATHHAAITTTLDAIAADRRVAYARVGITSSR
jgi:hypothetical protein